MIPRQDQAAPEPAGAAADGAAAPTASAGTASPVRPRWWPHPDAGGALEAFRYAGYRLFWASRMSSSAGYWMSSITHSWLLYELTGSILLLGVLGAVRGVPRLLFSLVGGLLADRADRRRVLLAAESANTLTHAVMAVLVALDALEVWHLFVSVAVLGTASSIRLPARQALLSNLVPLSSLLNAVTLSSAAMTTARFIGPAIAGVLLAWRGPLVTYIAQALSHALAALLTVWLPLGKSSVTKPQPQRSAGSSLREGFAYVWRDPAIRALLLLGLVPVTLAQPYRELLPVFARDVLTGGPALLGTLTAATAIGSIIAVVGLITAGNFRAKGAVLVGSIVGYGLLLTAFGFARWIPLSALLLIGVGTAAAIQSTMTQTLIITTTPDELRGRVVSIRLLDQGLAPVGMLLVGALASYAGAPLTIAVSGAICALLALVFLTRVPALRHLS